MPKTPVEYKKLYRTCTIKLFDISLTFYLNLCLTFCVITLAESRGKSVYKIRNHIEDFGESVLILDIDEFGSSILDDQDGTWGQFTGHSTAAVALLVTLESPCSYAEGNIHQRKDDRISDMDRISDNCLGRNKCIHSFKKRIYSILKIVFT